MPETVAMGPNFGKATFSSCLKSTSSITITITNKYGNLSHSAVFLVFKSSVNLFTFYEKLRGGLFVA